MSKVNMNAGKALQILMVERDINGVELAKATGLTTVTISSLRKKKLISGNALFTLCDHFGITAAEFFQKGELIL
tara:strand:+ start:559 stop:780 length:222 start_codon:yes stop_codon:yes gene_type:complete